MANENLYIELGVKDNGSKKTINELNKELKNLDKVYANTKKSTENFENTQEGLTKKLETLNKKYDLTKAKLEQYKKAMENSKETIEKKRKQLEELEKTEGNNAAAINKLKASLEKAEKSFNDNRRQVELTQSELEVLEKELNSTRTALNNLNADKAGKGLKSLGDDADYAESKLGKLVTGKIKSELKALGEQAENTGEKIKGIGEKVGNTGEKITKVSALGVAGLVALGTNANNITSSLDTLGVKLKGNEQEVESLKKSALGIYKSGFGESIDDSVNALVLLTQQIEEVRNASEGTKKDVTEQVLALAETFDVGSEEIARALGIMTKTGVVKDVQEGLDLITVGFQNGLNVSGEWLDTLTEYSPQFDKLGLSASEASKYIVAGMENGAWSIDKLADGMKEFSVRALEGSDSTKEAFTSIGLNADEMVSKMNKGGDSAKEVWKKTLQALAGVSDETVRNNALLNLMGTQYEDLGSDAILALSKVEGGMDNLEGSSKKAKDTLEQTFSHQFQSSLREIQAELLPLGVEVLDLAKEYLPSFVEAIKEVIKFLDKIPFKDGIAKATLYGTAIGGVTKGVGKFIEIGGSTVSTVGKIAKSFSKTKTATDTATKGVSALSKGFSLLNPVTGAVALGLGAVAVGVETYQAYQKNCNKTILDAKEDYSLLELAVASYTNQQALTKEQLEETGLVYKEFSKNISGEFKDSVNNVREDIANFNLELAKMTFDNVITEEESANLNSRLDTAISNCINTINSYYDEGQNSLINLFTMNDGAIDESEQSIIDSVMKQKEVYTNETNNLKQEIQNLVKQWNETNNEDEKNQLEGLIRDKYARIKQIELECQAQTDEEKLLAKQDFESQIANMDLETASKKLSEIKKNSDEQINLAKESYDQQRAVLLQGYDTLSEEEKAKRDEGLARAKETYESKLSSENEYWQECLGIVRDNNQAIYDNINEFDGKIMSDKDLRNKAELEALTSKYEGLDQITQSGYYKLKDSVTGAEEEMYIAVDESSKKIIGVYDAKTQETVGYNEKMKKSCDEMANNYNQNALKMRQDISSLATSTVNSNNEIINANGRVVGSLEEVKNKANGTKTGIIELNGQKIKIKVDKYGTISNLKEINSQANEASKSRTLTITVKKIGENIKNFFTGSGRASGMAYVPQDGFKAILHKGERVLTAQENREYNRAYFSPNTSQGKALSKVINNTYNNTTINNNRNGGIDTNMLMQILSTMQNNIVSALSNVNINTSVNIDENGITKKVQRNITRQQNNRRR